MTWPWQAGQRLGDLLWRACTSARVAGRHASSTFTSQVRSRAFGMLVQCAMAASIRDRANRLAPIVAPAALMRLASAQVDATLRPRR